jgi:hypothetical protein
MNADTVSIIGNLAIALSFVVAVVFGIAQVKAAERDRRERLTLGAVRNFQSREFAELLYHVMNETAPATQEEFRASPRQQQVFFIQFGQEMEHLGILVHDGIIDMDLVDKTLGSLVSSTWEKYKPMFLDMREKIPDPFLGEYFQWLAERIDKRMRENPRPPVHLSEP